MLIKFCLTPIPCSRAKPSKGMFLWLLHCFLIAACPLLSIACRVVQLPAKVRYTAQVGKRMQMQEEDVNLTRSEACCDFDSHASKRQPSCMAFISAIPALGNSTRWHMLCMKDASLILKLRGEKQYSTVQYRLLRLVALFQRQKSRSIMPSRNPTSCLQKLVVCSSAFEAARTLPRQPQQYARCR